MPINIRSDYTTVGCFPLLLFLARGMCQGSNNKRQNEARRGSKHGKVLGKEQGNGKAELVWFSQNKRQEARGENQG